MAKMKIEFKKNIMLFIPLFFVVLMWVLQIAQTLFHFSLITLGIYPRQIFGLPGILFAPLIHANFNHLMSNTLPFLFLCTGVFYLYRTSSVKIVLLIYSLTDILVWIFARPAYIIGASGLVYGFASFLFFGGVIRRDTRSVALALIVVFLYGGMIIGIFPLDYHIAWEAHLIGGIVGLIMAFVFRKSDKPKRYDWEDEEEEDEDQEKPEISYKKGYPFN
jgi:membrane associated rhomboid family serine protease